MDDQTGRSYGDMTGVVKPRRTRRPWARVLLIVLLVAASAIGGWYRWRAWRESQAARPSAPTAQTVGAAEAQKQDIRIVLNALGTVTSLATVTVKTQIAGKIVQIGFTEGQLVQRGDFLVQIDARPYEVALEQVQGAQFRDQALLKNAQLDLTRYQALLKQDSVSRQQVDTQAALVRQYEGTLKTDQAAIDSAELNLSYCHIVSPVGGRVGLRQVDEGNYVQPSDANGLVVVTQLTPISVVFALPEDQIPQVVNAVRAGRTLPVEAWDHADQNELEAGELVSIDNQVDVTTGTVKLRATLPNTDGLLIPNQFVNAKLLVDTLHDALAIPSAAIQRGEPGTFVYAIRDDGTVHVQPVKLGPVDGFNVGVLDGLQPGEKVVTDGADRLREGVKVTVLDSSRPAQSNAPAQRGDRATVQRARQGR
jgi:membrane fusion protein, multidrug efflux system